MDNMFKSEKVFDFLNIIFMFFVLNLFFMIFNIPAAVFILSLGISSISEYLPLFLICLIPTGTSFTILLYCMGRFIRYKDIAIIKDFIRGLKSNLKQSLILWCSELLLVFILHTNIIFFSHTIISIILTCLSVSLIILLLAVTPYFYILMSRFSMKTIDLVKASLILTFTRPIQTITNMLLLLIVLVLFEITPGTVVLFMSSVFSFLLMYTNKALLNELETNYSK